MSVRKQGPAARTSLAWQRSELALAFVAALVAAAALRLGVMWIAAAAGLFALGGLAVAVAGRPREVRDGREDFPPWPWLPYIVLASVVVGGLGATLGVIEVLRRV